MANEAQVAEPYRYWWGETVTVPCVLAPSISLAEVLSGWLPGSMPQPHTWDDEERDIFARICLGCGDAGHYQRQLEAFVAACGLTQGVCLGGDGRVWDGHHRIVAARRLGIDVLPLESLNDTKGRWLRDHGPVAWEHRTTGDIAPSLYRGARGPEGAACWSGASRSEGEREHVEDGGKPSESGG